MKVLVTGGTGSVGRSAVARLVAHGHQVRVIGRKEGIIIPDAEYHACDITRFEAVRNEMRGMEGVIHLAAIPNPALGTGQDIFHTNATGTFNVYEAAANEGIKRVVQASSINRLGFPFGIKPFPIAYFPIDEAHPTCTTDPYSFSKLVVEEIAAYYWRREGISGVSLRFPAVLDLERLSAAEHPWYEHLLASLQGAYRGALQLPPAERLKRGAEMVARYDEMRAAREFEKPWDFSRPFDPDVMNLQFIGTFWSWVDARDAAQSLEFGLVEDYEDSHPLFISAAHNILEMDSHALAKTFFPAVTVWKQNVLGSETLLSNTAAEALLGYKAEHALSF